MGNGTGLKKPSLDASRLGSRQTSFKFPRDRGSSSPRAANVVVAELISVTGPRRCWAKRSSCCCAWERSAAAILMMNGVHQVLADAPGVTLTHVRCRRHDYRQGLSPILLVVATVPRTIHRKIVSPNVRGRIGIAGSRAIGQSNRRGRDHAGREKELVDHFIVS